MDVSFELPATFAFSPTGTPLSSYAPDGDETADNATCSGKPPVHLIDLYNKYGLSPKSYVSYCNAHFIVVYSKIGSNYSHLYSQRQRLEARIKSTQKN